MKIFASIALLLLTSSATLTLADDTPAPAEAKVVLSAPAAAKIGELVRLDASKSVADSFKWIVIPESSDFLVYDGGARAVFSARVAGKYRFVLAVAKGGSVDVITYVVTVGKAPERPQSNDLRAWIPYWRYQLNLPHEQAAALAASFDRVASRYEVLTKPQDWIKATAEANREALGDNIDQWVPLLDKIGAALRKMAENGQLKTPEQHRDVWKAIAEGLRKE
ncbi:MAG: hypothetical protein DRH24_16625 [Deltaproteobacteria bacterium]|nr:MAG: hypothetical protein DRH24_16625 [Deltaproteobacteria bacterium]